MESAPFTISKNKKEVLLAKFSNADLQNDTGMRFGLFTDDAESKAKKKRKRKQMVAETKRMTYVGKNYGPYAAAENNMAKYLVGVFDKDTNKVKVYNSEIFLLRPHFPDDEKEGKDEVDMGTSFMEKVDALTEAFGVGKKKKAMSKRQQVQIGSESMKTAMKSAVKLAMKEPSLIEDHVPQDGGGPDGFIPPHHKDATKPQEAYVLEDLISPEELDALRASAQFFMDSDHKQLNEMKSTDQICSFVLSQLKILPVDSDARIRKACIVTYLHYLILMFKMKPADLKQKEFLPEDVPGLIKKKLSKYFTVVSRDKKRINRTIPPKMKDKILLQILVIGLILEDFNLEFSNLLSDLKVTVTRMNNSLKALGCKVKAEKVADFGVDIAVRVATLPIPLKFPEKVNTPRKKRPNR